MNSIRNLIWKMMETFFSTKLEEKKIKKKDRRPKKIAIPSEVIFAFLDGNLLRNGRKDKIDRNFGRTPSPDPGHPENIIYIFIRDCFQITVRLCSQSSSTWSE